MTVYYEGDKNRVVANNAEHFVSFDEDGRLVFEFDDMERGVEKLKGFSNAFDCALEANKDE